MEMVIDFPGGARVDARFGPYPPDRPGHRVVTAPDGDLRRLDVDMVFDIVTEALGAPSAGG